MRRSVKKDPRRYYRKPTIKSSKIKTISFYGRSSFGQVADAEMLLAVGTTWN